MTTIPPKVLLRQLFIDLSEELPKAMTFKSIANLFYKYGIIDLPENPYGTYQGTKRDYVLDKLNNARDLRLFLTEGMEEVTELASIGAFDDSIDDSHIRWVLNKLGYTTVTSNEEHGISLCRAPEDIMSILDISQGAFERIDPNNLPIPLSMLVDELNVNLSLSNFNAAALLLRRILTYTCFVALKKKGLDGKLVNSKGESLELSAIIENCKQEYKLTNQLVGRVISAKWIGDSANHSYAVQITESDVESSVTAVRLFIDEIGIRQGSIN